MPLQKQDLNWERVAIPSAPTRGSQGELEAMLLRPLNDGVNSCIIYCHPYSVLGGCLEYCAPVAHRVAQHQGDKLFAAVVLNFRGVGLSSGRSSWTGFSEVDDIIRAMDFVQSSIPQISKFVVFGMSAGACIGSSAAVRDKRVSSFIGIGYTLGWLASVIFSKHQKSLRALQIPSLLVQGEWDCFTSVGQLKAFASTMTKSPQISYVFSFIATSFRIIKQAGHFDIQAGTKLQELVDHVITFLNLVN